MDQDLKSIPAWLAEAYFEAAEAGHPNNLTIPRYAWSIEHGKLRLKDAFSMDVPGISGDEVESVTLVKSGDQFLIELWPKLVN
jgi:hypothetical protein